MTETLTNSRIKLIKSLKLKKNRKEEGLFVVEGAKNVLELLHSDFEIHSLYCSTLFLETHSENLKNYSSILFKAAPSQLTSISSFKSNDHCLALVKIKENCAVKVKNNEFALILDGINDPGNLGTIIRTCDWFGIRSIIASEDTVEVYNPKVIAATMGSFTRVSMFYTSLEEYMRHHEGPYLGAFMEGKDVHQFRFGPGGYIVMGNESNGIRDELKPYLTESIAIPAQGRAESLNVAIATAVILDNIRRLA